MSRRSGACALCGTVSPLRVSHIVPKFVGKWLKDTSATGFLRQATDIEHRIQDLRKEQMLCDRCEERFSQFESKFAKDIFYPYHGGKKLFEYEEWLLLFVVSVNWRVLRTNVKSFLVSNPLWKGKCARALKTWRDYLVGASPDSGPYEHHILFLDLIESAPDRVDLRMNSYIMRAIDATLGYGKNLLTVYTKLPGIIFVSAIEPQTLKGWHGTKIGKVGSTGPPQKVLVPWLAQLFENRTALAYRTPPSQREQARMVEATLRDRMRLRRSKTTEVKLHEELMSRLRARRKSRTSGR